MNKTIRSDLIILSINVKIKVVNHVDRKVENRLQKQIGNYNLDNKDREKWNHQIFEGSRRDLETTIGRRTWKRIIMIASRKRRKDKF